jgi:branched-chain amino acid transport system ATP-binding protein
MNVLEVDQLQAGYGKVKVLHGISLTVPRGGITVLLGANGAGKSTTLRAISGLVSGSGSVRVHGTDVSKWSAERIARLGVAHVPEGRGTFASLTVEENLWAGGVTRKRADTARAAARWYEFFPRLHERRKQVAGTLSGGEQQMLAIARAMMLDPSLLLLDEPSMGLAPNITSSVFETLERINEELGVSILVVEQNALLATSIADTIYVLETGRIVLSGPAEELRNMDAIQRAYLGGSEELML